MLLVDAKPTVAAVFACSCSFCYKNGLLEFHPSASVCVCVFFFLCVCFFFVCVCMPVYAVQIEVSHHHA